MYLTIAECSDSERLLAHSMPSASRLMSVLVLLSDAGLSAAQLSADRRESFP